MKLFSQSIRVKKNWIKLQKGEATHILAEPALLEPVIKQNNTGILLINLGTPTAPYPKEVLQFLRQFLSDPHVIDLPLFLRKILSALLPFRAKKTAKLYQKIWLKEGSPLQVHSERLRKALEEDLRKTYQVNIPVYLAMTYGTPSIESIMNVIIQNNNIEDLIIIPLFPQYSKTTTKAIWNKVCTAAAHHTILPNIYFMKEYTTEECYIQALATSIEQFWIDKGGRGEKLLFSFHGIPKRYVSKKDNYPDACKKLTDAVAKRLKIPENSYEISFQSRFGFGGWVTPYTRDTLCSFVKSKVLSVDVVSPSFAVDCLETLEELNIQMRHLYLSLGGKKYQTIPALNDDPIHIAMLKHLIQTFF